MVASDTAGWERKHISVHGETIDVLCSPEMTGEDWDDARAHLLACPDEAAAMAADETNPDRVRMKSTLSTMVDAWRKIMADDPDDFAKKIKALEEDDEFKALFEDLKECRWDYVTQHLEDKALMMKVSRRMGGVPRDAKLKAEKVRKHPLTLQDACKFGDIAALQRYLSETDKGGREIDAEDHRGITCLGYAVGANRSSIAKLLIESKADPKKVDVARNSALHYAAAYGRKEMSEYLLGLGSNINAVNDLGMTPLACATRNNQKATIQLFTDKGGK